MAHAHAVEHGGTHASTWLRERRLKIALGIALVEGVLIVADVIPNWLAILVGAAIVGYWYFAGRHHHWQLARQVSWTAALSQVFMALVPVLLFLFTALAVAALVVIAVIALIALLADRR